MAFSFWILKFRTQTYFYSDAHTVYVEKRLRKLFCQGERDVSAKMAPPRVTNCGWI
jgi:hypothetical protein